MKKVIATIVFMAGLMMLALPALAWHVETATVNCVEGTAFLTVTLTDAGPGVFQDNFGTSGSFGDVTTFTYPLAELSGDVTVLVLWANETERTDDDESASASAQYNCEPEVEVTTTTGTPPPTTTPEPTTTLPFDSVPETTIPFDSVPSTTITTPIVPEELPFTGFDPALFVGLASTFGITGAYLLRRGRVA